MQYICALSMRLLTQPGMQVGADGDAANGWVSDAQLATQIAVLNAAYAPLQVSFVAAGVQRLKGHSEWWYAPSARLKPDWNPARRQCPCLWSRPVLLRVNTSFQRRYGRDALTRYACLVVAGMLT